ncbi:nuclear apoptosis-inducing factor 1 isoform X1 [Cygnus olor]|uniref:nuclear apoptosis-inducing factor 1 isoform X1 n=1 Tax=Cygnus olor TaxID=8869 RepID=UPI001ADE3999|nr:nuclear apoptosis-inducing factor 1 isoform X1 [Cygnus olor]
MASPPAPPAKKRKMNFSEREVEIIVEELERGKHLLVNHFNAGVPLAAKAAAWHDILRRVNAVATCRRELPEVKKKWSDLKTEVRRKVAQVRAAMEGGGESQGNGGGGGTEGEDAAGAAAAPVILTPMQQRICNLLGEATIISLPGGECGAGDGSEIPITAAAATVTLTQSECRARQRCGWRSRGEPCVGSPPAKRSLCNKTTVPNVSLCCRRAAPRYSCTESQPRQLGSASRPGIVWSPSLRTKAKGERSPRPIPWSAPKRSCLADKCLSAVLGLFFALLSVVPAETTYHSLEDGVVEYCTTEAPTTVTAEAPLEMMAHQHEVSAKPQELKSRIALNSAKLLQEQRVTNLHVKEIAQHLEQQNDLLQMIRRSQEVQACAQERQAQAMEGTQAALSALIQVLRPMIKDFRRFLQSNTPSPSVTADPSQPGQQDGIIQ